MSIIFAILKGILIVIGIILLIVIALIGAVLLVPIRYNSSGIFNPAKDEGINIRVRVGWLLGAIRFKCNINNNGLVWKLKLLFITIAGTDKKSKSKKSKVKKAKKNKKKAQEGSNSDSLNQDEVDNTNKQEHELNSNDENSSEYNALDKTTSDINKADINEASLENDSNTEELDKPKTILDKLKALINKIKGVIRKLIDLVKNFKAKLRGIIDKLKLLMNKLTDIKEFLETKEAKTELQNIKLQVIKLLCHLKPTRLKANIRLGLESPDKTGTILGGLCVLYGFYGNNINLVADFKEQVIDIDYCLKGRIRLIKLVIVALKIYGQKNIVNFVKKMLK